MSPCCLIFPSIIKSPITPTSYILRISSTTTMSTETERRQPWTTIWPDATEYKPQNVESQGLNYNFKKGETMVIDGSAQRGNGFVGGEWKVEAESNKASDNGKVVG